MSSEDFKTENMMSSEDILNNSLESAALQELRVSYMIDTIYRYLKTLVDNYDNGDLINIYKITKLFRNYLEIIKKNLENSKKNPNSIIQIITQLENIKDSIVCHNPLSNIKYLCNSLEINYLNGDKHVKEFVDKLYSLYK